jgi:hypothetical protein
MVGICGVLCLAGLALHPVVLAEKGLLGCVANLLELSFFAWLVHWSPFAKTSDEPTAVRARAIGWAVGLWLGLDLLGNYLVYRTGSANQLISLVVYGVYALGMVGIAGWSAFKEASFRAGLRAVFWYVIPAQLTWHFFEFASFYALGETPTGQRFLHEEMAQDMARSDSTNFEAFTMGDFYGAGFLHLLVLGLGLALVIGSCSAAGGWFLSSLQSKRTKRA